MTMVKYLTELLPDGHLPLPARVRKLLELHGNDTLEVTVAKLTPKNHPEKTILIEKSIRNLKFDSPGLLKKISTLFGSLNPEEIIYNNRR